jgi:hypothetical protein
MLNLQFDDLEKPKLCAGFTHDARPCGNRPIDGTDYCGSHQPQHATPTFIPNALTHGGTGVIPRTQQELELLAEIDDLSGFDLARRVEEMQVKRIAKKVMLEPELKEAHELLRTVSVERGVMQGQQFSRTIQERPDLEAQLDRAVSTLLKVTVESNKQNAALTVEQQASELTKLLKSTGLQPINLDTIPGGDSDLFQEDVDND